MLIYQPLQSVDTFAQIENDPSIAVFILDEVCPSLCKKLGMNAIAERLKRIKDRVLQDSLLFDILNGKAVWILNNIAMAS